MVLRQFLHFPELSRSRSSDLNVACLFLNQDFIPSAIRSAAQIPLFAYQKKVFDSFYRQKIKVPFSCDFKQHTGSTTRPAPNPLRPPPLIAFGTPIISAKASLREWLPVINVQKKIKHSQLLIRQQNVILKYYILQEKLTSGNKNTFLYYFI